MICAQSVQRLCAVRSPPLSGPAIVSIRLPLRRTAEIRSISAMTVRGEQTFGTVSAVRRESRAPPAPWRRVTHHRVLRGSRCSEHSADCPPHSPPTLPRPRQDAGGRAGFAGFRCLRRRPPLYEAGILAALGRSQVVRQRILIPPSPGSNPGAPAN